MADKSIGDFYVNIIPKFDEKNLEKGASSLAGLGKAGLALTALTTAGLGASKFMYGWINDTARATAEMAHFAESIGMPIERVHQLRKAFQLVGLDASQANGVLENLTDTVFNMRWGEIPVDMMKKAGLDPSAFGTDQMKNLDMLSKALRSRGKGEARALLHSLGVSTEVMALLSSPRYAEIMRSALRSGVATGAEGRSAIGFVEKVGELTGSIESLKRTLVSETYPAMSSMIDSLNNMLKDREFINAMTILANALADFTKGFAPFISGVVMTGKDIVEIKDNPLKLFEYIWDGIKNAPTRKDRLEEYNRQFKLPSYYTSPSYSRSRAGMQKNYNIIVNESVNAEQTARMIGEMLDKKDEVDFRFDQLNYSAVEQ